jgi:hypothetical protein
MRLLALLLLLLLSSRTEASPLKLDYSAFTVSRIYCNKEYLAPEILCQDWFGKVDMDMNFRILDTLFMRNNVHGEGTRAKFMTVGWRFEAGLALADWLEVGWSHHSRHVMDQPLPQVRSYKGEGLPRNTFPSYDAAFFRLIFVR